MSLIEHDEGWKPRAKALYDEAITDRDRWRREYEAEKAKVRRVEHDLRGAVSAMREAAELLEETGTPEYVNPPTVEAMQRVAAELRTAIGGQ